MAIEQQNWKFTISAEVINGDQLLHIHPENFTNLIISYDYQNTIMPTILAKVSLDKNLMDFIIQNADTVEIYLTIKKFTHAIDDINNVGNEYDFIKGTYLVSIGNDINYNKELDYLDSQNADLPTEDKFKETYIGLVSKESVDANKIVANEVIHQTLHQDLVLSYLLPNCHLLIEPFEHNEMHNNLIVPPLDTMASLIKYLNDIQVFYSTNYILFFDEPKVTYLLSRSGKATPMEGEEHTTIFLNMRSLTDSNNLTLGLNDNQDANAYEIDVPISDSNYNIDKDTGKMIDSIDAIVNPSLENSILSGDKIKNAKNNIQGIMKDFLLNSIEHALSTMSIGSKISDMIGKVSHAIDSIQKVSMNLMSQVGEVANQFGSTITKAVGSQIATVQGQCNKILQSLPANIMGNAAKSVQKSMMDSRFMSIDISRAEQKQIKSDFCKSLEESASSAYKQDFIDNNVSAVTYVMMQEVVGQTTTAINNLSNAVTKGLGNFQNKVSSKIGEFSNFASKNVELLQQVQGWKKQVLGSLASSGGSNGANSGLGQVLKQIIEQEKNLSTIVETADKYGSIVKQASKGAEQINQGLKEAANSFQSFLGSFSKINEQDVKGQLISKIPTRIFGNSTLSVDQLMTQTLQTGGCFGDSNSGMANTWGNLAANISGSLNFSDLSKLASNLMNFDLSNLGPLGLNHFNFDLNLADNKVINKVGQVVGTKLFIVGNDNINMLKNIKSDLELSRNQLSIFKAGLDPDIFTPNKEYVIKNYEAHNKKDGKFILNKKILVFVREDQRFKCNSQLFFAKVPEPQAQQ